MAQQAADSRTAGPSPPFSQSPQVHPGTENQMTPEADHGEHT
jgi:hypothetical protein